MTSTHFALDRVGESVWAAVATPGGGALGNAGIVNLGSEALIFDTTLTPAAARDLRAAAEDLCIGPVRWVVNSHWHGDHVRGNASMPAEATIVSTARTRELIATTGIEELASRKANVAALAEQASRLRAEGKHADAAQLELFVAELPSLEQRLPDETFEEHRSFDHAELLTFGGGHTDSDAVLWLGGEGVLFTADLVVAGTHPWVGVGHPETWLGILDRLDELGATTIVPGHGPVSGGDATGLVREYLSLTLEGVAEMPARLGLSEPERWDRNRIALRERRSS